LNKSTPLLFKQAVLQVSENCNQNAQVWDLEEEIWTVKYSIALGHDENVQLVVGHHMCVNALIIILLWMFSCVVARQEGC
jgi:hypothetical protein